MKLIKGAILFIIYLFNENIYYNKLNTNSLLCNNMFLNITPIKNNKTFHNYKTPFIKDNSLKSYTFLQKENNKYNIFIYVMNKLIIFLGHCLIIFIYIKNNQTKNKMIVFNNITKRIVYDSNIDECSICYVDYKFHSKIRKIIKCSHIYHEDCIKEWIIEYDNKTCPLCRCNVFTSAL